MEITVNRSLTVNPEGLQAELQALLAEVYGGFSTEPGKVRIFTTKDVAPDVADSIALAVLQHNEKGLTDRQSHIKTSVAEISATKAEARQALKDYDATIAATTEGWSSMDAAQKLEALANIVLKTSVIVRFLGYAAYDKMA